MRPSELLRINRDEILALATKAGALNVRVFGSTARGDDREESDLDLPVSMMTAMAASCGMAFRRRVVSMPSMPGIRTSIRTRSGRVVRMMFSASAPLAANSSW